MTYNRGDVVIVKFPFVLRENQEKQKGRPAVILNVPHIELRHPDFILASISSRVPEQIMDMEILLEANENTGLIKESLLRLDFIMTIPEELISRKIGQLSEQKFKVMNEKLKSLFGII